MDRRLWWAAVHRVSKSQTQFSSVTLSCPTLCDPMDCRTPGLPVYQQLPEFTQAHVHWVGDAIQPSHPLSSPSFLAFSLFEHQVFPVSQFFASGGQSIGVSASTSVLPMNTHSGLISSRMDWLDLLAVQGTFKSLLEHHSSKASILQCSAFFMGQLSHTAEHNWELSTLISPIRRGVQSP